MDPLSSSLSAVTVALASLFSVALASMPSVISRVVLLEMGELKIRSGVEGSERDPELQASVWPVSAVSTASSLSGCVWTSVGIPGVHTGT